MAPWQATVTRAVIGAGQTGSRRLRWIWETEDGRRRLGRVIARLIGSAFIVYAIIRLGTYWPWVGAAEIIALLWYGHAKAQVEEAEQGDDQADEELDEYDAEPEQAAASATAVPAAAARPMPTPAERRQLLIDSVRHLAGARQGVHLDQLHTVWSLEGDLQMDLSEFRRWVEAHGITVRNSLKVSGATRIGIRLDDLPAAAAPAAAGTPPPVVPDDLLQDWQSSQVSPRTTP